MINKSGQTQNADQATAIPENRPAPIETGLQNLAAAALTEGWMENIRARNGERTVSANELTSLSALIAYVAHVTAMSEFRIERKLADRFNVPNVKCLPSARFDDAIRHLVDQVPVTVAA